MKKIVGIILLFMLVGCDGKISEKEIASDINSTEDIMQPFTIEETDTKESGMLKGSFGTVKEVSESKIVIEGVDSKIYTGDPRGFEEFHQGDFVYLEFSDYEETEDGYNVKFTILEEEDRKKKVPLY